jgi:SPRY domain
MIGVANSISTQELVAFGSTMPYSNPGSRDVYSQTCLDGVCYNGKNGNICNKNKNDTFGSSFSIGDVIGTLVNVEHCTVTYYKNGVRVGTADMECPGHYPYVCLLHEHQEIMSYSTLDLS